MDDQEKKVYVAPQMIVEDYDHQGVLLTGSCTGDDMVTCVDPRDD